MDDKSHNGRTANVGSGGLYFETSADVFEPGELLNVELTLPPTSGLLEFGGKIMGYAHVLRAERLSGDQADTDPPCDRYGVAIQFCRRPKLCV